MQYFNAPWNRKIKVTTTVFLFIIGYLLVGVLATVETLLEADAVMSLAVIGGILLTCAFYAVRGYSITENTLMVHRVGWAKRFDLSKLTRVDVQPGATVGSLRTWGIGGLFGFVGRFYNEQLGSYRAYATDGTRTVVLDFSGEKVVVTPDEPVSFAEALRTKLPA